MVDDKFSDIQGKFSDMQEQIDELKIQSGSAKGWKKRK